MQPGQVIVKDKDILGGTPVFRGTRVPFQALLDYLEGGQTLDEFLDDFPTVTREEAVAGWNSQHPASWDEDPGRRVHSAQGEA